MARTKFQYVAVFVVALGFGGCGGNDGPPPLTPPEGGNPDPATDDCNVVSDVCFLPYPSSVFATDDPSTPTGLRIALPQEAYPTFSVSSFNQKDGFPPATAIVTHFPEGVSQEGLPSREDRVTAYDASLEDTAPILLLDIDAESASYGERVPYFAEAVPSDEVPGESLLVITPMRPLEPSSRYAVIVTDSVLGADRMPVAPDPETQALLASSPSGTVPAALWEYYDHLRRVLPALGIPESRIVQAWDFHTRSDEGITRDLLAMRDEVQAWLGDNPPSPSVTSMEMDGDNLVLEIAYEAPIFREDAEAPLHRDDGGRPALARVDTLRGLVVVPAEAEGTLTPLVFGHGFGMSADDLYGLVGALDLSSGPYALGLFDWDLHGERGTGADALIGLISPDTIEALAATFLQSTVDEVVFGANLRAMGDTPELEGRVDDTGHLYGGVSMGGVYGTVATSIDDHIRAAVLNVPGGGIINIVRFSSLFEGLGVRGIFEDLVRPEGASTTGLPVDLDAEILLILSQLAIDDGDAINYGRHLVRDRLPGMSPDVPPVLLQESIGDAVVPNFTTESLARAADLPLVGPAVVDVPGLEEASSPTEGMPPHGLAQFRVLPEGVAAHLALGHATLQQQLLGFYGSMLDDDSGNDGNIAYQCSTEDGSCNLLGPL
ncbi:MAG: hypothetical protein ACOC97_03530 [Myxococcota bacterium]